MKTLKPFLVLGFGVALSWVLYPLTHGARKRAPELFGIAVGCVAVNAGIWLLWRDADAVLKSFVAQALVGLGVAANRVRLEVRR